MKSALFFWDTVFFTLEIFILPYSANAEFQGKAGGLAEE